LEEATYHMRPIRPMPPIRVPWEGRRMPKGAGSLDIWEQMWFN